MPRLLILVAVCVAAPAAADWNHVATHTLPPNTHRPEILALPDGGVMVVTVSPDGPMGIGRVKHKAYRLDADWNPVGDPFVVTAITAEFGEPADHRAALVNGELVVLYQSLIFRDNVPMYGPAENAASEQSLLMARFSLDGKNWTAARWYRTKPISRRTIFRTFVSSCTAIVSSSRPAPRDRGFTFAR
jgi:hypothetical protein